MADEVIKAACGLIANEDTQALFLIGCTCVGAYTFLRWFMQVISIIVFTIRKIFAIFYSCMWPFICCVALVTYSPAWRELLLSNIFPKYYEMVKTATMNILNGNYNALLSSE
ncbi:uncharacterized protein [Onthophagus taurus]|uniref:uncharacterized protein isoform X1 n=1 Tax=Onthophagus taurus TaxID=166361 RepID=UPI0039BDE209